jgi:hypothetical protein
VIDWSARTGGSEWTTSLWPKDGGYLVPIKAVVKRAEQLEEGQTITIAFEVGRQKRSERGTL